VEGYAKPEEGWWDKQVEGYGMRTKEFKGQTVCVRESHARVGVLDQEICQFKLMVLSDLCEVPYHA